MGTCWKIFSKVLSFYAEIQFIRSILLYEKISGQDFCVGLISSQIANALDQILPGVNQHISVHFNTLQGFRWTLGQFFVFSLVGLEVHAYVQTAVFPAFHMFSELMSFSSIFFGAIRSDCCEGWLWQLQILYLK